MTASAEVAPAGSSRAASARVAVIGVSSTVTCGVRDHAMLLASALEDEDVACTLHWLNRTSSGLRASHGEISAWTRALAEELARESPDALLLHYSVFAQSYRGVPLFVAPTLRALRSARAPLIAFLHEFAYPWRRSGARGALWALSQRGAFFGVMRASAGAVVTVEERVGWLRSRPWLPQRPVAVAPVFSTLPPPAGRPRAPRDGRVIGLFGYSCKASVRELVLDALALMRARDVPVKLTLLGAPGPRSEVAEAWRSAAGARSIASAISFSGLLPAQELSDALASCDLLLFADRPGPTSRKTTLAASLASGRPVLAIDGHSTWRAVVDAGAVELTAAEPGALAGAAQRLIGDERLCEAIGARGRTFAAEQMGVARSAGVVAGLLREVLARV